MIRVAIGLSAMAALLSAQPAQAAIEHYSCGASGETPTLIDIDLADRTFDASEGSLGKQSICSLFAASIVGEMKSDRAEEKSDILTSASRCPIGVTDGLMIADLSTHTANVDLTALLIFDRDRKTFRIAGRVFANALDKVTTCRAA